MNCGILLFPVIRIRRPVSGEGHSATSRHLPASARLWQARPPAEQATRTNEAVGSSCFRRLRRNGWPPQQSVVSCIWGTDFVALRAVRKDNDRLERLKKEAKASHP
jgi:hypothetical protein